MNLYRYDLDNIQEDEDFTNKVIELNKDCEVKQVNVLFDLQMNYLNLFEV